jgi:hypothetical protein
LSGVIRSFSLVNFTPILLIKLSVKFLVAKMQWIFWVGPFVGAAIAAGYHQYILRASAFKAMGSFRSQPNF